MEARDFIKQLIDAGMTQAQIAEKTGMAQPTVSKILRGDVRDVMSRKYRRLEALHGQVMRRRKPATTEVTSSSSAAAASSAALAAVPAAHGA